MMIAFTGTCNALVMIGIAGTRNALMMTDFAGPCNTLEMFGLAGTYAALLRVDGVVAKLAQGNCVSAGHRMEPSDINFSEECKRHFAGICIALVMIALTGTFNTFMMMALAVTCNSLVMIAFTGTCSTFMMIGLTGICNALMMIVLAGTCNTFVMIGLVGTCSNFQAQEAPRLQCGLDHGGFVDIAERCDEHAH